MKKLRISSSLNLHSNDKSNFEKYISEGLSFHKAHGFDAADFTMSLVDFSNDLWQPKIEYAIKASNEIGLRFEVSHLPFSAKLCKEPDFIPIFNEQMHRAIDAAALLGVEYAVMHPNTTTVPIKKYNVAEQRDSVLAHLSPFVEHANRVGLNVIVENMRMVPGACYSYRYCQSPDELCDIADALGIGVCWDFGHANISIHSQSEALAYVGKRLKLLHVNDNTGIEDDHILPFTGTVDWRDAMHGLALAEYDGLFNYELHAQTVPSSVRSAYAKYMIDAANEMMTYIE